MSCPDCFRGSVHTHAEPTGKIETVHGLRTYVAGGSDPARSKSTIIYLPDAFSLKLVNNKILADKYAATTGCKVLIPDVVLNGGMPASVLEGVEYIMETPLGIANALPKFWTILTLLPHAVPFMLRGHPKNVYSKILAYARAERAALPPGGKLGVCGFCWGAWGSTKLCGEATVANGSEKLIDAQFNGHPSYIKDEPTIIADNIKVFKTAYASAVAEKDFQFNAEVAAKTEADLRESVHSEGKGENGFIYDFHVYKGATHGFCVKAREEDMQNYHDAAKQATDWFQKYLN
jgi:dienelactone hydrolase